MVLAVLAALTLIGGRLASSLYADWAWYTAQGAVPLYRSSIAHMLAWRTGAILTAFAFAFFNLYALRRSIVSLVLPRRLGNIEIGEAISPRTLLASVFSISAILSLLLSAPVGDWTTFAFARLAEPFREMDPYLDRDLAFVVAWLPFERDLQAWAARTAVVVTTVIVVLYALTPSLRLRRGDVYVSTYCRRHLSMLAAVGLLVLAWGSRLDALSVTSRGTDAGQEFGAYAHQIGGPLLVWVAALSAIAAFVVLWAGWNGHTRVAAGSALAIVLGAPIVEFTLPRVTAGTFSSAIANDRDRPYANARRLFTRRAFGVDAIDTRAHRAVLAKNAVEAVAGIPLWDPAAVARAVSRGDASDGAALSWHGSRAGIVAAAIIPPRAADGSWGYAPFDAAGTDERGRILPAIDGETAGTPRSGWEGLLVYPGAVGAVVFADTAGRIPAPAFGTTIERVAHAWNARSPRLAFAVSSSDRSRIVSRRDVRERVTALAPFLTMGHMISPLVRGDSLFWVAEMFTVARAYPLSEPLMFAGQRRPYVHHAATAFVHAGTGRVTLVATRTPDAIMRTWMRRFPWMFAAADGLPAAIADRRPPLAEWASLQATALARTGIGERGSDARGVVGTDNADADLAGGGPTVFVLPGGSPAWSVPMVDAAGAVTGSVIAVGGRLSTTVWVSTALTERWSDILDRLQQSADSAGIGRQRPGARRGRVLTVPLAAGGHLYVQSHYEWGTDASPVATGAAAVVGGVARAGVSLTQAMGLPRTVRLPDSSAFRTSVELLHQRMREALRAGDWTAFGGAFSALGQLLRAPGR